MFCCYFCDQPVFNFTDAKASRVRQFALFFHGMLEHGIYLAPSQFEVGFISTAHTQADIDTTLKAVEKNLTAMK